MKKLIYLFLICTSVSYAQHKLEGVVLEKNNENKSIPVVGANLYWLNSTIGTNTDFEGKFSIEYNQKHKQLVISFVGYKTDTITVANHNSITHYLTPESEIDEVVIKSRKQATAKSYYKAANIITVNSDELLKAACCNLAESFETNPSIDVNFADAITGTRQIKMLGLTSPYLLIATENVPTIRGAAQAYGLSFTPGTWVESIQITKGAGSVVNGFESIAGQINVELQKPSKDNLLFVNAYAALDGRLELNTHVNTKVSDKWHTGIYLHGNTRDKKSDNNNDTFLDMPLAKQVNFMNRWQYTDPQKGFVSFFNFNYLNDEKQTGQTNFNLKTDKLTMNAWGSEIKTKRFSLSGKLGYVNPEVTHQSVGLQLSYSNHDQDSYFGLKEYNIEHNSAYANVIYNSIISDTRNKFKTGINATYDTYKEKVIATNYDRKENSIGAFFEYSYDNLDDLTFTAGIRVDNHNLLGTFVAPRFHLRYTPWEKSALRTSFGRGKRSANIFAENQSIFSSSRAINILNSAGDVYGLDPEIAWNYGISFMQKFKLFGKRADITLDYYRTDFQNQIIVDLENPQEVNFYNLDGKSVANSFQAEVSYNLLTHLDFRFAYKHYNVKTDYTSGNLQKALTPKNRFFANASYQTHMHGKHQSQWKFDVTFNWLDEQRFSSTASNPVQYQLPNFSPTIGTLNAQVTRIFSEKFEVYLGGENITNVQQENPILGADNPFGSNFDTSFVYGPIFGSSYYVGLRYKLK